MLGRTDLDFVKLPGGVLSADEIERVLRALPEQVESDIFELHRFERETENGALLEFVLHVQARPGISLDALANDIAKRVRVAPGFSYADGVAQGRYFPIRCTQLIAVVPQAKRKRIIRH